VATALAALLGGACAGPEQPLEQTDGSGGKRTAPTFVGRESCAPCHEHETRLWSGSHHDLAMQEATERTVLGDFGDATFTHGGVTSTFFRREGRFFVRTDGPDGELDEFEIAYTFGAVPLQQYLIEFPGGRYQALSISWDTRPAEEGGQRWFHLYPDEEIAHDDPLHWTGSLQNWNYMCAECHSTNVKKGYLEEEDRYETTWSEIDVSCEACHGPGSEHVDWARAMARDERPPPVDHMGLAVRLEDPARDTWLVNPETGKGMRLAPAVETWEMETCARCHSRRTAIDDDYAFGRPVADTHRMALLDEDLYHADGQILEEVYVHGSYLQSKMYQKGVTCSDCHDPHGLGLKFSGDDVCARCHPATEFDSKEHHFHKPETSGAHCVDCHMVPRNYMVVDPRHDHSLRVPRPDLSLELGTPNACNDCHRDKTVRWAAETVARWYGPDRRSESHYGEILDAGRRGLEGGERALAGLIDDKEMPGIVRASALELLRAYLSQASLGSVENALADSDPLVRRAALTVAEGVDLRGRLQLAFPLLEDPVRTVRMEAARVLASVPDSELTLSQRSLIAGGLAEYEEAQRFNADRAESRLNLGWLHIQRGELGNAEKEYLKALEMVPWFSSAYVNLADLYRSQSREAEGEQLLRRGLERAADPGDVHHALGLLLVRRKRLSEALPELQRAADLHPNWPRYVYVYGVALHSAGQVTKALAVLENAHRSFPVDREILMALTTMSREVGAASAALDYARKLLELTPQDPGLQRLVEELKKNPA
jgi:tetratricopeptide (TPR) repeat protein